MRNKIKHFYIFLIICIIIISNFSYASFINDFFNLFSNRSNYQIEQKNDNKTINKLDYDTLNDEEKEICNAIENIYNSIITIDVDKILQFVDYNFSQKYIANFENFLKEYPIAKEKLANIFNKTNYEILEFSNAGEITYVKIKYTYPSINDLISKTILKIATSNAKDIIKGNFNNKNIVSIIQIINDEINKNTYKTDSFTYDFAFSKINGKYKLIKLDKIYENLSKIISKISKDIVK